MSGYTDGGYLYEPPLDEIIPERTLTDARSQTEIRTFRDQLEPLISAWAPDQWKPYFENEHLGNAHRLALEGLRDAVAFLRTRSNDYLPLAFLRKGEGESPLVLVGDLSRERGLESWQRKNERGVTSHSVVLFFAKNRHYLVCGDQSGVRTIDSAVRPSEVSQAVDSFNYLPHIDGTTNYTVRHFVVDTVAIGRAVMPLLREHGMQRTWEHYLSSVH